MKTTTTDLFCTLISAAIIPILILSSISNASPQKAAQRDTVYIDSPVHNDTEIQQAFEDHESDSLGVDTDGKIVFIDNNTNLGDTVYVFTYTKM